MADSKISNLDAVTSLTDDDLLVVVNDPAGTPTTNKITVADALGGKANLAGATFSGDVSLDTRLLLADGTAASPAIGFTNDQDSGLYYAAGAVRVAFNGTQTFAFDDGVAYSDSLLPSATESYALGGVSNRWNTFYTKDGDFSGTTTITTADINGGDIDNTAIGNTTPSTGTFTTLSATGDVTLGSDSADTITVNGTISATGRFITPTELGYIATVTSDVQSQLNAKQDILTEGAFADGDKTKLDGIEANADVTDATNVAAAGAVMDSDFSTNGLMKRTGDGEYTVAAGIQDNATTTSLVIDSNGYVTRPTQPCILLNGNDPTNHTVSAGEIEKRFSVDFNVGITWNATTGAVTVPVAGKYLWYMQGYDNGPTDSHSSRIYILHNGAGKLLSDYGPTVNSGTLNLSIILDMQANDYVKMVHANAVTMYTGADHQRIYGYLLG